MATVYWPGREAQRQRLKSLADIPFIIHGDDYPDGINAYLFERVRGRVSHNHNEARPLAPHRLGFSSSKRIAHDISDVLNWAQEAGAHPILGSLGWKDIRAWHIVDLYQDALIQGFWTQDFWSGIVRALAPDTIRTRVGEALRCYRWMSQSGFVEGFDYEPRLSTIQTSKDDALLGFRRELREIQQTVIPGLPKRVRTNPGDTPLPSIIHLQEFFEAISSRGAQIAAIHMFETGVRASEVVENTLLPGCMHQRQSGGRWHQHATSSKGEYLLQYSLDDNRMLGVIPPKDFLVPGASAHGYGLDYRILGKGPKIRKVSLSHRLLRSMWAYADVERPKLAASDRQNAYLLLNRFGDRLSYHAIWEAFDAANARLQSSLRITPHTLRYAHACYFLEAGLIAQARKSGMGDDLGSIPHEFLSREGNIILMVIKNNLGHSEFETTKQYLDQIISGRLKHTYLVAWNSFLGHGDE